jgi:hypothetical protein
MDKNSTYLASARKHEGQTSKSKASTPVASCARRAYLSLSPINGNYHQYTLVPPPSGSPSLFLAGYIYVAKKIYYKLKVLESCAF